MFAPRYFAPRYFAPRYFPPVIEIVVPPAPVPPTDTGRGSGPTDGIQPEGYTKLYEDRLLETRRKRILSEDDDIVALIVAMITKGLM